MPGYPPERERSATRRPAPANATKAQPARSLEQKFGDQFMPDEAS